MKIYNFQCETFTPFAPLWDYVMGEKLSKVDYYNLKEEILQKEKDIIGKYDYKHDNNTGLGKNSLTSRSKDYNLLEFDSAGELRKDIRLLHDEFIEGLGFNFN